MKEIIEFELYPELKEWIEEVAFFFAEDVNESGAYYYEFYFLDDCLLLMEELHNCTHVHQDIMEALKEACEYELFKRGIYAKLIKIKGNTIIFKK